MVTSKVVVEFYWKFDDYSYWYCSRLIQDSWAVFLVDKGDQDKQTAAKFYKTQNCYASCLW